MNSHHPFTALWAARWRILTVALIATVIAWVATVLVAPSYKATTTILIESRDENIVPIANIYSQTPEAQGPAADPAMTEQYLQTQFEILKSRPVIQKVIQRLKLTENPEFGVEPRWHQWLSRLSGASALPTNKLPAAVSHYEDILDVDPVPKTQLVTLSISSRDAELAAAIANAHARAFIESYWNTEAAINSSVSTWMEQRAAELKQKLAGSEARLQAFKEKEHLMDVNIGEDSGIGALPTQQLATMSTDLIEARRALYEHTKIYEEVNQARNKSLDEKLAIPLVNADALVTQFKQARSDAQRNVADIAKRYGPSHPSMVSAVASRQEAEHALANQVDSVMDSIDHKQQELQGQVQALAVSTNRIKVDVQSVSNKDAQYRALMQAAQTDRDLYAMFDKRINEAKIQKNMTTNNARVVEPATIPAAMDKPKTGIILLLTFLLSSVAYASIILFKNAARFTFRGASDVEAEMGLIPLGLIPRLKRGRRLQQFSGRRGPIADERFMESIGATIASIYAGQFNSKHKLVLVTSPYASEGKTLIACNVALELAKLERVLLIDADLRQPSIADWFAIEGPGLAEACTGSNKVNECIVQIERDGLDVLPAGKRVDDPQPLLNSEQARHLFHMLAAKYDRVIIDSPAVLPTSDALLIAEHADSVIFVIKAQSTTVSDLKRGLQRFENSPVHFEGVVLNQVDLKTFADYDVTYYAA